MNKSEISTRPIDALAVLNNIPGCHLILLPDTPRFTIVGVTDAYLATTHLDRENTVGQGVFETNTDDPANLEATGVKNLLASLRFVIAHKQEHRMEYQRYDILNPVTAEFECRIWSPLNKPVLDGQGDVQYIIHTVEEVTEKVRFQEERKITDQKLRERERLFRNMVEQAPVAISLTKGEDVVIESISAPMLQLMNKKAPEDVLGKRMIEVLPELADQQTLQNVINVQKTGIPFRGDEQPIDLVINGKLEHRYFNILYTPVKEAGEISAVLHVAVDVTEQVALRRETEEVNAEAEKQQRLYETINATTPDLICVFDLTYRFTYINQALLDMWGRTWKDSIGKTLREVGYEEREAHIHEKEIDQVIATKKPVRGEVSLLHASLGPRVYDYIFAPVINKSGEVEAVGGTTRDITDRRQADQAVRESEERFRNLANDTPAFMFMADAETNLDFMNKQWLQFAGLASNEGFGKAWERITHPDDVAPMHAIYFDAVTHVKPYRFEIRQKRSDGIYRWILWRGMPRKTMDGKFAGMMGVGIDITEQKEVEEKLEKLVADRTKALQRSNEDLQQFAHVASHDLREPVRKIKTYTTRLQHELANHLSEGNKLYLDKVNSAADRMFTMIEGVLTYSSLSALVQPLETVDLMEVLKNIATDLEVAVQRTGAVLFYTNLPVMEGVSVLLYQLFYNLINNSLKFARPGVPPVISIGSQTICKDNKEFARIHLKDNGIGFDQQYAQKIFDSFTRLHSKDRYEGTGLGLALCKKIAERHSGSMEAYGIPGEGAEFIVMLPFKQPGISV